MEEPVKDQPNSSQSKGILPGCTACESTCAQLETRYAGKYKDARDWRCPTLIKPKCPDSIHVFMIKKINDESSHDFSQKVLEILLEHNTKVLLEENTYKEMKEKISEESITGVHQYTEDQENNIDFLIVIGGDGTIMYTLKYFQNRVVPPLLAFSKGALNYLCNVPIEDYEKTIRNIINAINSEHPIEIEKRTRLRCELRQGNDKETKVYHALNEIVIGTGTNPKLISIDCDLEGKYFATFIGDGVMVSTPTGSTAYQLSNGGPIINHLMSCMSISTIAGLSLSNRPVILPSGITLTFRNKSGNMKKSLLNLDGQVLRELDTDFEVTVTGSTLYVPLIIGESKDTFDNWIFRLRNFLGWNRNFTNENAQTIYK